MVGYKAFKLPLVLPPSPSASQNSTTTFVMVVKYPIKICHTVNGEIVDFPHVGSRTEF
jgi:hypothetical protein